MTVDREQIRRDNEYTIRHALDMGLQAWRTTENSVQFTEAQDSLSALIAELAQAERERDELRGSQAEKDKRLDSLLIGMADQCAALVEAAEQREAALAEAVSLFEDVIAVMADARSSDYRRLREALAAYEESRAQ